VTNLVIIGLLGLFTGVCFAQTSDQESRDQSIPESLTAQWTTSRDLFVLLDEADNRVALANAILNAARDNPDFTVVQRTDGLRVAGHALYGESEFDRSAEAFEALIALEGAEAREKSSAWRMLGQIRWSLGDLNASHIAYTQAYEMEKHWFETGQPSSLDLLVSMHAYVAARVAKVDEALAVLDHAVAGFAGTPGIGGNFVPRFIEQAGEIAEQAGRIPLALDYYAMALEDYPEYGLDEPFMSTRATLRMKLHELNGRDITGCNQAAMEEAWDIIRDPAYKLMPMRHSYARAIAKCLEKQGGRDAASHLRSMILDEIAEELPSLTNPVHIHAFQQSEAQTKIDEAQLQTELEKFNDATTLLNEVITDWETIHPLMADRAREVLSAIPD
jgi:tetratricopeptide (TPR) repeat protein